LIGDNLLEAGVLGLQLLEAFHGIDLHAAILFAPAVEGRLADTESPGDLGDRGPRGQFGVRFSQLADDLLWSVPLLHRESSFCPSRAFGLS